MTIPKYIFIKKSENISERVLFMPVRVVANLLALSLWQCEAPVALLTVN